MTDEIASSTKLGSPRLHSVTVAVSLVGFMGAGKTTVGRALAERLGWRFVDLDDLIQAREGRTIEQIFDQNGEPAFRDLEHDTLRETIATIETGSFQSASLNTLPLVLGLGGGAFIDPRNQEILRRAAVPSVFLDAPAEELFRRCEKAEVVRPLRREFQSFCDLCEQRRPSYARATWCVSTAGKDVASVVSGIILELNLTPSRGVFE